MVGGDAVGRAVNPAVAHSGVIVPLTPLTPFAAPFVPSNRWCAGRSAVRPGLPPSLPAQTVDPVHSGEPVVPFVPAMPSVPSVPSEPSVPAGPLGRSCRRHRPVRSIRRGPPHPVRPSVPHARRANLFAESENSAGPSDCLLMSAPVSEPFLMSLPVSSPLAANAPVLAESTRASAAMTVIDFFMMTPSARGMPTSLDVGSRTPSAMRDFPQALSPFSLCPLLKCLETRFSRWNGRP